MGIKTINPACESPVSSEPMLLLPSLVAGQRQLGQPGFQHDRCRLLLYPRRGHPHAIKEKKRILPEDRRATMSQIENQRRKHRMCVVRRTIDRLERRNWRRTEGHSDTKVGQLAVHPSDIPTFAVFCSSVRPLLELRRTAAH